MNGRTSNQNHFLHLSKWKVLFAGLLVVGGLAWWFCLPDPLFPTTYSTVLLDRDGHLLGARPAKDGQWRFPGVDLKVPETFQQAIIHFEDKRFFNHSGVDFLALGRAMRDNFNSGRVISGGSTLTMQTMRMARKASSRSIRQKTIEILWAWRAELRYSKKDILRLYAAHAPFGGNVVGLGAASWRYFHKMPDQLSWGEAATLAVLPNAPGLIHPGRNRETLLAKRNQLIRKLEKAGVIDSTEASLALEEPLPTAPHPLPNLAPHVLSHYLQEGKTLYTTIDMGLQEQLTELLQRHSDILSLNGVNNAALLLLETESGAVRAYIGNVDHAMKGHHNDVDIIRAERSSGSILKPFLYCAALEDGWMTPKGLQEDIPTYIRGYQPLNFTKKYMGMVPADLALAMSLNVPAVRLLQRYGILPFKEKLIRAGITTLHFSPNHYGLPLVLGGAEVKLWDICGAYATMGRVLSHAYVYDHLYDPGDIHGPLLFVEKATAQQARKRRLREEKKDLSDTPPVWDAGAVWLTFEAMRSLQRPDQEGQWETFHSSRPVAWKTGTSFGYRDAWAVGVTPRYTLGVWVGNADGEGRPGVIGLHAAAPVMFDALRMLGDGNSWWSAPFDALQPRQVCRESGWLATSACSMTDTVLMPRQAQVPEGCTFHVQSYTDSRSQYRYDPACMPGDAELKQFFVVPAVAESYYRRYQPAYEALPPWHPSCSGASTGGQELALLYPRNGSKIYIPYQWDRQRSRAVFSAVHRSDTAQVYWHLDKTFIGRTREFHQIEIDPSPGLHTLVLQDERGSIVTTTFEVIADQGRR